MSDPRVPGLADEAPWYAEHAALFASTLKWATLGAVAGLCAGLGTKAFLWALRSSSEAAERLTLGPLPYYFALPAALPVCVWLVRRFAPDAKGHGTEAVIAAVHQRSGRIGWNVAPVKLLATVATLAFGGSVGKEGPAAQIGATIASAFASLLRLSDPDRRKLVICGISGGFASVFGTPISGALFGIEVLYLGRIEYDVLLPCLVSGIVAHLVCATPPPVAVLHEGFGDLGKGELVLLSLAVGVAFGLMALALIEMMRALERGLRRFENHPYAVAAIGGLFLTVFYRTVGSAYAGLGLSTIDAALQGAAGVAMLAFLWKIVATSVTLGSGGSGGIATPLFFIGATGGAAIAHMAGLPVGTFAAFGLVSVLAAAANTPIAAAVMGMELLPASVGVWAALSAATAFLIVGYRSVYPTQRIGSQKTSAIEAPLDVPVGEIRRSDLEIEAGPPHR